jgi:hypothetical protein
MAFLNRRLTEKIIARHEAAQVFGGDHPLPPMPVDKGDNRIRH